MKKVISMLIALTMIISMIPVVFANGTEEPYAKTYDLTRTSIKMTSGTYALSSVKSYTEYNGVSTDHEWMYFGYSGNLSEDVEVSKKDGDTNKRVGHIAPESSSGLVFRLKNTEIGAGNFALSLKAPVTDKSGFYVPSVKWRNMNSFIRFSLYMGCKIDDSFIDEYMVSENLIGTTPDSPENWEWQTTTFSQAIFVSGGEDIVAAFQLSNNDYGFSNITLTKLLGASMTMSVGNASLDLSENKTTTASVKVSGTTDGTDATKVEMPIAGSFVTYRCEDDNPDEDVVTVSEDGTITAVSAGEATIWAETADGTKSNEITVTVTAPAGPEEDTEIAAAFGAVEDKTAITSYQVGVVSSVAYTVGTDAQDSNITAEAKDNNNGTYTLNAPEYSGYNFLYWKKGVTTKKDVITYQPTGFVYTPTAGENNIVIAVYEKKGETTANRAEFYNANGQFIKATDGSFPQEQPSMAGYGDATGWKCYTDGKTYGLNDSVTPNGIMLFVADYKANRDTVSVVVHSGYGDAANIPFGTKVTCTPVSAPEGQVFRYWTKSNLGGKTEIVSIDEEYSFFAYEDCTVKAIFADAGKFKYTGNTRKILLDTFVTGSAKALMAEFIGFENDTVVEKGIMFGSNRIAMKSTGAQFTIIPDEIGTYKGYAIVKNDDEYTLITDGSYTKSAE